MRLVAVRLTCTDHRIIEILGLPGPSNRLPVSYYFMVNITPRLNLMLNTNQSIQINIPITPFVKSYFINIIIHY
jgi:hypothetical protein